MAGLERQIATPVRTLVLTLGSCAGVHPPDRPGRGSPIHVLSIVCFLSAPVIFAAVAAKGGRRPVRQLRWRKDCGREAGVLAGRDLPAATLSGLSFTAQA